MERILASQGSSVQEAARGSASLRGRPAHRHSRCPLPAQPPIGTGHHELFPGSPTGLPQGPICAEETFKQHLRGNTPRPQPGPDSELSRPLSTHTAGTHLLRPAFQRLRPLSHPPEHTADLTAQNQNLRSVAYGLVLRLITGSQPR